MFFLFCFGRMTVWTSLPVTWGPWVACQWAHSFRTLTFWHGHDWRHESWHSDILVLVQVLAEYLEIIETFFKAFYFYGLSENKPIPILSFQCGLSHFDESILRLKEISRGRRWSFIKHNKVEWSSYKTKVKILISFFVQKLCPLIPILMSNWLPYSRYSDELVFIILPILSLLCNTILPYKDRRILTVIDGNLTKLTVKWLARHFFNWV